MIPQADIIAWRRVGPWADDGMVEQDFVLSRALVEIFSDAALAHGLALRGGTALHKLVLVPPSRYSEDLDLVQVEVAPIGAVLDRLRARLDPWLGKSTWDQAASSVTPLYRFASEIPPVSRLRLKVEINTREHFAVYGYRTRRLAVESRWFGGGADVRTFHLDELNPARVIEAFQAYLKAEDLRVTRAEFERNLAAKARNRLFIEEVTPMLAPGIAYDARAALDLVQREFVERFPGGAWKGAE